jgi:transcriptional regulator with GAF, ATPase, and Fis domain
LFRIVEQLTARYLRSRSRVGLADVRKALGAPAVQAAAASPPPGSLTVRQNEREHVMRVLEDHGWSQKDAAAALGIAASTLNKKLVKWEMKGFVRKKKAVADAEQRWTGKPSPELAGAVAVVA